MARRPLIGGALPMILVAMVVVVVVVGAAGVKHDDARHHVVGGDQGWDVASDLAMWSLDRVFRVGDNIWFTYSAKEGIAELRSKEQFESCDLSNPIRMYTDGLDKVTLDGEGPRYFTSTKSESCKDGLKLHVKVLPRSGEQDQKVDNLALEESVESVSAVAEGPTPSGAAGVGAQSLLWCTGLALLFLMSFQRV